MTDTLHHKGRRRQLVEHLAERFPFNSKVLEAIGQVPRHLFVEKGLDQFAYFDRPLSIGANQTISQPFTVAMQTHLLALSKWDKVLEIGTGCGYQTAVLLEMGYRVFSIERQKSLYLQAQNNLFATGYKTAHLYYGDGFEGLAQFAPFQGIIVTCGASMIPQKLADQLVVGGRIVIPVGATGQTMTVVKRLDDFSFEEETYGDYSFVPMLPGKV
ncbi:MAG: protein-L-isoaspartate(D-aspartate) O-methyltransferase [Prevotellaceae bacterium]|jgi:protein-L-isoaspartate(D-aspartate) O-methyltransferase|nr:protein-L-isoaspartate(D-aspartate) O-methyltransferase [Prevotellaceae bacterium]